MIMRIAMIHTPLVNPGGAERLILRLAVELQEIGHTLEVFTNAVDYKTCFPELLKKITVNVIPFSSPFKSAEKVLGGSRIYYRLFEGMLKIGRKIPKGFDVINNHNLCTEWAAFIAKKRLRIPTVWMCNEPPFWFFHPEQRGGFAELNWPLFELFDKIAVRFIDEIVVMSNVDRELVRRVYGRSSTLIREGVDVEAFEGASGDDFRRKYRLKENFIILQVGALHYYKKPDDSIRALYLLSKKHDRLKLVLVGLGSTERLKKLCMKLKIEDKVMILGRLSEKELLEAYAACDVFVFPAEQTWGLVVTEAMAAAKPVIVSEKAGVSEILTNGETGIIVRHADPIRIAKKIESLLMNPDMRMELGKKAHQYVKNYLSWRRYAESMERILERNRKRFRR